MSKKSVEQITLEKNRFVISEKLIGQNVLIKVTNKDGKSFVYDHDKCYTDNKVHFDNIP